MMIMITINDHHEPNRAWKRSCF
jgi:ribosome biogenesis GTPase / thiamine phosphate phosphatase